MKQFLIILAIFFGCNSLYAAVENNQAANESARPEKNAQDAKNFMRQNAKKAGIKTLPSGLQYKVIETGSGPKPRDEDIVVVDYAGNLVDGTEFDSSYKRGEPATFPVSAVIPGWTEALKLMNEGSTWMLYIPPSLAYGDRGAPPAIGPNEALIFKVHLINVKKQS